MSCFDYQQKNNMDLIHHELLHSLKAHHPIMVEQLHQFCQINSHTDNLDGLEAMRQLLTEVFKPIADTVETYPVPLVDIIDMQGNVISQRYGETLLIRKRPKARRRVLLMGHMDTVYPLSHSFQTLRYLDDNCLNGPGVTDMKGGLIVMLHALQCFEETHDSTLGWDVLINADEESGSPSSAFLFGELAPSYQAALVYEPSMSAEGAFAKNRRGSGKFTLIATGKAAHVGRAFHEGRNAICYLAEVILAIHALNDKKEGVTINVGKIAGGEALNMVPDKALIKLDIRISDPQDKDWILNELQMIIQAHERMDYSLTLQGSFGRPVKRVNQKTKGLFNRIKALGHDLGLNIHWKDSGGCCDGNNLAELGLPVIDTLGVRGGNIHSPEEFILLDSLVERAALSALLLQDLAQGNLERLSS